MYAGLTLQVLWFDDDVMSVRIAASNGAFSGVADLYASPDMFARLADEFQKFPTSGADSRELELGTFDQTLAGGGTKLSLTCADALGHGILAIQLRGDPKRGAGSADFKLSVEANAIDAFLQELRAVRLEVGAAATLRGLETFAVAAPEESNLLAAIGEVEQGEIVSARDVLSKIHGR